MTGEEWEPTARQKAVLAWAAICLFIGVGLIILFALGKWVMS